MIIIIVIIISTSQADESSMHVMSAPPRRRHHGGWCFARFCFFLPLLQTKVRKKNNNEQINNTKRSLSTDDRYDTYLAPRFQIGPIQESRSKRSSLFRHEATIRRVCFSTSRLEKYRQYLVPVLYVEKLLSVCCTVTNTGPTRAVLHPAKHGTHTASEKSRPRDGRFAFYNKH
jgi:hypothetical protein